MRRENVWNLRLEYNILRRTNAVKRRKKMKEEQTIRLLEHVRMLIIILCHSTNCSYCRSML